MSRTAAGTHDRSRRASVVHVSRQFWMSSRSYNFPLVFWSKPNGSTLAWLHRSFTFPGRKFIPASLGNNRLRLWSDWVLYPRGGMAAGNLPRKTRPGCRSSSLGGFISRFWNFSRRKTFGLLRDDVWWKSASLGFTIMGARPLDWKCGPFPSASWCAQCTRRLLPRQALKRL